MYPSDDVIALITAQVLSVAVYNHYQRLRHEDSLAAARKEREEVARGDVGEGEPAAEAVLHPDHLPYPPTSDLRKVMADRQRFTRSLFDEDTRWLQKKPQDRTHFL